MRLGTSGLYQWEEDTFLLINSQYFLKIETAHLSTCVSLSCIVIYLDISYGRLDYMIALRPAFERMKIQMFVQSYSHHVTCVDEVAHSH